MKGLLLAIFALAAFGCQGGSGSADASASGPSAPPVKSAADLPKDMPAQAKASAASAMGQAAAAQQMANDPARVKAMEEMKKQHGG